MQKNVSLQGATLALAVLTALVVGTQASAATAPADAAATPQDQATTGSDAQHAKTLSTITVLGTTGYATKPSYHTKTADLGPLGNRSILDTPMSVTVLPGELLTNQQIQTVNDALRDLPSVTIRDQQGLEVSRPQSRGFVSSVFQNTRLDGMSIIGTTAIAAENLSAIQVLNGMAGSLYGPETPAGVFNYILKRPSPQPILRLTESYDSQGIFTEQGDFGGPLGPGMDYRLNVVHGEGEGYVDGSSSNRTLVSGGLDYHFNASTDIEADFVHYETNITGLPGSTVYFGKSGSTVLPPALSPKATGLSQVGAGTDLHSDTGLVKLTHDFGNGWTFVIGGLYENAIRNLWGITNTFTDDLGDYNVTKNFTAIPRYVIASNMAQLNGHFQWLGTENDLSIGTNGYSQFSYTYRNSIAVPLGSGNIYTDPLVAGWVPTPANGGRYRASTQRQQSLIVGDTMHFNEQWAAQAVLSASYLNAESFNKSGTRTSNQSSDGQISPTLSVIYTPTDQWTAYATWARSVEPGDQAPTGTVNAQEFMSPYHDKQYEAGAKYAVNDDLLLSAAVFRMTRPLAQTITDTNVFQVVGEQRNRGMEFFAQGRLGPDLSILGGVTYLDARVIGSTVPDGDHKLVVGVPHVKTDVSLDFHPGTWGGWALTGAAHFQSKRAATNTNNSFAPSFATFDAGVRWSMPIGSGRALTFRGQIVNFTNKHYYAAIADGNIVGSPGSNTAYYGAPRTYMASVEVDL